MAARYRASILPSDTVITADCDAFVMSPALLLPLQLAPAATVWVWNYNNTHHHHHSFAMSFVGGQDSASYYNSLTRCYEQVPGPAPGTPWSTGRAACRRW